jgi:serine-type D-Ala-D-Ala carboxypeptidase (penicillin-binding protein 5/6)
LRARVHLVTSVVVVFCFAALTLRPSFADTSACVVEAETGLVIFGKNESVQRPPASMIKLMLMLMVAEGLEVGAWTLDTPITATKKAQGMGGTQVYLAADETWSLGEMMKAVAVGSANDAAMAVAESLWGSEEAYSKAMNGRAQDLGMTDTEFHSVHGLPPSRGESADKTTAYDMALLGRACVRHESLMSWVGTKTVLVRNGTLPVRNTNELLWKLPDCDGLKTGYIRAAGFCVTATVERDGVRLISVVMGYRSGRDRFNDSKKLLEDGFARIQKLRILQRGEEVGEPLFVANAKAPEVRLQAADDVWVVVPKDDLAKVEVEADSPRFVKAPLPAGTVLGEVLVKLGEMTLARAPLVLAEDLVEPSIRWKLRRAASTGS